MFNKHNRGKKFVFLEETNSLFSTFEKNFLVIFYMTNQCFHVICTKTCDYILSTFVLNVRLQKVQYSLHLLQLRHHSYDIQSLGKHVLA